MPSVATDILSVEAAKLSLRIDGSDADADLEASIAAAVAWCETYASKPLLDRTVTTHVRRPIPASEPLCLPSIYVKSITRIEYWTPAQALREGPAGTVMVGPSDPPEATDDPIGRREVVNRYFTAVYPPAAGWPEVLTDSRLRVVWVEGFDGDPAGIDGIRKAVTLMTGAIFDGTVDPAHRIAAHGMLQPFVDSRGVL